MIARLLALLGPLLGALFGESATKTAGVATGAASLAAIGGGVLWLFGPGRDWSVTLNALELSGVILGASALLEWFRRLPPPGPPS